MLVKLVIPALVVLGATWVLVQPDTPHPVAVDAETFPTSAVELLGETWTVEAPQPVVRPLTAAENAAAIAAMQRPVSEPRVEVEDVSVARAAPLRQPVPRPARPEPRDTVVILAPGADAPEVVVLRGPERSAPAVARADIGNRWIVRRQGSGDVVAEVSLAEALAILTSR